MNVLNTSKITTILSNTNLEEVTMSNVELIKAWYAENEHLLEPVITTNLSEDKEFRSAQAAMKGAIYNIENTGRRQPRGFNSDDLHAQITTTNHTSGKKDWLMSSYTDHNGRAIEVYDDGGVVASIVQNSQAEIAYGKANESSLHGRNSLVEEGFGPGLVHVTDIRGNSMGAMTLSGAFAYEAKEASITRELNSAANARLAKRAVKKELALKVLNRLSARIIACNNYGDIKAIIQGYAQKFLQRTLVTYTNNGYVTDHCKFIKDGKETTLNSWFLSYFYKKLWASVELSAWKKARVAKASDDQKIYEALQAKLNKMSSICDNMHHMADLLRSGTGKSFGIAKSDIQPALNYAKANKGTVRGFSTPVFYALIDVMKAA